MSRLRSWARRSLGVGLLACCYSALAQLPTLAITDEPTDFHQPGKFVWADLVSGDAKAASQFYADLFDWKVVQIDPNYFVATNKGKKVAGIAQHSAKEHDGSHTRWLPFISNANPDQIAAFTQKNGGQVLQGPLDIDGRGRAAILSDPEGAVVGVLNTTHGDPTDHEAQVGEWIWQELWASNPKTLANFYLAAGYSQIDNWMNEKDPNDIVLESGGYARASIVSKTDPSLASTWLLYVRVESVQEVVQKTQALQGKVLMKPSELDAGYPVAILSDPTGGVFAVVEWSPDQEEDES